MRGPEGGAGPRVSWKGPFGVAPLDLLVDRPRGLPRGVHLLARARGQHPLVLARGGRTQVVEGCFTIEPTHIGMTRGDQRRAGRRFMRPAREPGPTSRRPRSACRRRVERERRRSFSATQLATIRISSISSAGIAVATGRRGPGRLGPLGQLGWAGQRAPVDQPALHQPERVEALLHGVLSQHEPRRCVGGPEHSSSRSSTQASRSLRRSRAPPRARSAARRPPRASARRAPRAAPRRRRPLEVRQRRVELAAVRVRVEVAQAGRHAAAHLAVRRRVLAELQRPAAMPQPVQRGELVRELGRPAPGCRAGRCSRRARPPARPPPRAPGTGCPAGSAGSSSGRCA